jgi:hypothetical protein
MNVSFFSIIGNSLFKLIGYSVFFLFINNGHLLAQNQDFCATPGNIPDFLKTIKSSEIKSASSSYTIGIFFHVMRRTDGTGGQTQQEVNTALSTLISDYQPYNINIYLLGTDEIKNDTYYNYNSQSNFEDAYYRTDADGDGKFDVFKVNTHINAIDIYLFADDKLFFGLAANIPGTALVIGGNGYGANFPSSHVLSHELGHCLGLYHTFHGTVTTDGAGSCPELVNESNGTTCGDFVLDTPADPAYIKDCGTQSTCIWNCSSSYTDANGAHYNPNTHLFMAYTFPNCMNLHTSGQVTRMFSTIANSCLLYNTLVSSISGPTTVCSSGATFTVNVPTGCTVYWDKSSNITLPTDRTTNPIEATANGNGPGWILAIVSSSCGSDTLPQLQVSVRMGTPATPGNIGFRQAGGTCYYQAFISPVPGADSYDWSEDNVNWENLETSYGLFDPNSTVSVYVRARNGCGVSATKSKTKTMGPTPPNCMMKPIQNSTDSTQSVSAISDNIIIYPNPAESEVTVCVTSASSDTYEEVNINSIAIIDSYGNTRKIKQYGTGLKSVTINVSDLPNGFYYIRVNNNAAGKSHKFLIQK